MTKPDLLRLLDRLGRLWPQSGLSDASTVDPRTLDLWYELLGPLPVAAVRTALDELARSGREFAPPPGVVWAHAQPYAIATRPRLVEALPTPEERGRAARQAAALRGQVADLAAKKGMDR